MIETTLSRIYAPNGEGELATVPTPEGAGSEADGLRRFEALRHELFELDTRFAQVGERGIFCALDRAGVLDHRVGGIGDIETAMRHPPARGRARLRGTMGPGAPEGAKARGTCDWTAIWDRANGRILDLSDPFGEKEAWRSGGGPFVWTPPSTYC